jgi:dienelactone hydrolase
MNPQAQAHDDTRLVAVRTHGVTLEGELAVPSEPAGVVLFAHGSGSSRLSPRNRYVAQSLRSGAKVGTLLIDLLSEQEESVDVVTAQWRFDIPRLAGRVAAATNWLRENASTSGLPVGYFGASTGAAAALVAAATRPNDVAAIVSRGGRPDLAGPAALMHVRAPTLLIVGGEDHAVIELNRTARSVLRVESRLDVIPGASHLFEEPGKLEEVARRAADWFGRFLRAESTPVTH